MSEWSLDQVRAVQRFRVGGEADAKIWDTARDALADECGRQMRHDAHTFAVEIEPCDVRIREVKSDRPERVWMVQFVAWWEPETREVELSGGHVDGERITFERAPHDVLRVPRFEPISLAIIDRKTPFPEPEPHPTYSLAGWHETERHWIYATK